MLRSFLGSSICFMGSWSHFAYVRFMKFLVAPKSTSAIALARLEMEWIKNQSVIDFRADKYTSPLLLCLISANLIRQWENPHLFPFLWPKRPAPAPSCYSVVALPRPLCP